MRIIHFSHCDLGKSQASTDHVMRFADGLARKGHRVRVVSPAKSLPYRHETPCEMQYFSFINVKGLRQITAIFSGFFTLLRLKKKWKPDCLYIRRLVLDPMPGIFAWITGTPLITETNGQIEVHRYEVPGHRLWRCLWYPLMLMFERILFANSFAVTADGDRRVYAFKNRYQSQANRFYMVRSGGIDLKRFQQIDKAMARKELELPLDRRLLIWVGTIFKFSGVENLIQVARKICTRLADVDFLIVGDGVERKRYMKMVAETGLSQRVQFTGYIANNDLYRWLSASDLALAPYNRLRLGREDFTSYKIFEYLACGLPVVCSFEGGGSNIRYVSDYRLGAVVSPENDEAFADAVINTLNVSDFFTEEFAKRCRSILQNLNVTWDSLVDQIEEICFSAVSLNGAAK